MGGLFSAPKAASINLPRPAPLPSIPQIQPETTDFALRAAKKRKGFSRTILTGALSPTTEKKQLLGE